MQIDELISRAASEGERTVARKVATIPQELLVTARAPGGMPLTAFLSAQRGPGTRRGTKYRHIFGAPAGDDAIGAWRSGRPGQPLPMDLEALVRRVNGIHLWADEETGRSYVGLAPIEEWETARVKMFGANADRGLLDDRFVALSYDEDGAAFVVLDVESGVYYLMDAAGPDTSAPIANTVEELLDWLWRTRIEPK